MPRTSFDLTNVQWVRINSIDLALNDDNFGANVVLNLRTHLEGLQFVFEYF